MDRDKSYPAFLLPPSLSCRSFCSLSLSFPLSSPLSRNLANVEYTNLLSSTAFLLICVCAHTQEQGALTDAFFGQDVITHTPGAFTCCFSLHQPSMCC